jgi:hypothetical protein
VEFAWSKDTGRYPYLLAGELAPVAEAFDNLFSTIKTKKTATGTALYSKSENVESFVSVLSGDEVSASSGETIFDKARTYFRDNLQGKTINREGFGEVRVTGKGWHKLKRGLKTDELKAQLIPATGYY